MAEKQQLAANTIQSYLKSLVGWWHSIQAKGDTYIPTPPIQHSLVQQTLRAALSVARPASPKLHITKQQIMRIAEFAANIQDELEVRDTFATLLMYTAMLRSVEVAALTLSDVTLRYSHQARQRILSVQVSRQKNQYNKQHQTEVVVASKFTIWWFKRHWQVVVRAKRTQRGSDPLFAKKGTTQKLSSKSFIGIIRRRLMKACGLSEEEAKQYGSHSGRSGGATAMANANVPEVTLKRAGRWRSDAVYLYTRTSEKRMAQASKAMGL